MIKTKLWVDDIRNPPDETWTVARTYDEAIKILNRDSVDTISLDHDLGEDSKTGYDIVCWVESTVRCGNYWNSCMNWQIHSANPVGRQNMIRGINAIQDFTGVITEIR